MLNKEMLLTSQANSATDNIVNLWVGENGTGGYGYCGTTKIGETYGTLDRIPYWYGSYDGFFALGLLCEIPVGKFSGTEFRTYYPYSGTPSKGNEFTIKVTRCDTQQSITFSGEHRFSSTVSLISLDLMDSYMHHVLLEFDPPQTAIYNSSNHLFNGGGLNAREGNASPSVRRKRRDRCVGNSSTKRVQRAVRCRLLLRCNLHGVPSQQYGTSLSRSTERKVPVSSNSTKTNKIQSRPYSCRKLHSELSQWSLGQFLGHRSRKSKEKKHCEIYLHQRFHNRDFLISCMGGSHA